MKTQYYRIIWRDSHDGVWKKWDPDLDHSDDTLLEGYVADLRIMVGFVHHDFEVTPVWDHETREGWDPENGPWSPPCLRCGVHGGGHMHPCPCSECDGSGCMNCTCPWCGKLEENCECEFPPDTCVICLEDILDGQDTVTIVMDMDPANPEVGPMPDIQDVTIHRGCQQKLAMGHVKKYGFPDCDDT